MPFLHGNAQRQPSPAGEHPDVVTASAFLRLSSAIPVGQSRFLIGGDDEKNFVGRLLPKPTTTDDSSFYQLPAQGTVVSANVLGDAAEHFAPVISEVATAATSGGAVSAMAYSPVTGEWAMVRWAMSAGVFQGPFAQRSTNGTTWVNSGLFGNRWANIYYIGFLDAFVAVVRQDSGTQSIGLSIGGANNWLAKTMPATRRWCAAVEHQNVLIVIALSANVVAVTVDGSIFVERQLPNTDTWKDGASNSQKIIIVADSTNAAVSYDSGTTWSIEALPISAAAIASNGSIFVAFDTTANKVAISSGDGSWQMLDAAIHQSGQPFRLTYTANLFVASSGNSISYSANGAAWETITVSQSQAAMVASDGTTMLTAYASVSKLSIDNTQKKIVRPQDELPTGWDWYVQMKEE